MIEQSRTRKSIFNASSNLIIYIVKTILSFILRTIFIKTLGELYLGINGLLTNVLSMLSLAELGVSSAISFSLYKPLAEKDNKQISALMTYFKKVYNIIGIVVLVLGIILFFFLEKIIPEYEQISQIGLIYFLYLINTVSTYYISYKEILITADQNIYRLTKINIFFTALLYLTQIATLLIFQNFVLYLIVQIFVQIIQKIFVNKFITQEYEYIDYKTNEKIEENTFLDIKKNVKAMFFHKIGDYCINGTDNIIISAFVNVVTVGRYSNYLTLVNMINTVITMVYNNLTASFGNLLVSENKKRSLEIFNKIDFIAFLLYSFAGIVFTNISSRFVAIWIGEEYILQPITVILLSFSFFLTGTRVASSVVRNAAGLYDKDKFIPVIQSLINIILSIILSIKIGLNGVIIGTIISGILPCVYRAYILYKNIFNKSYKKYLQKYYIKYLIFYVICMLISFYISTKIMINGIIGILLVLISSTILYFVLFMVVFYKYSETLYIKSILEQLLVTVHKKVLKRK